MLYIILGLTGLLIIVALFTFIFGKPATKQDDVVAPDADCCGAHEVCEKGLKKMDPTIIYYEDEELDLYKHLAADAYSDQQLDTFRDVMYTLRKEEVENWLISLEKREILFPDLLKQELLDLLA
ncbi:hypothetical protein LJB94_03290 [Odoribacter sp. OttesenSCG-928-G04]|nr:hypothetical protein [Odoribacter sp. OttesenSCG-928-G04]